MHLARACAPGRWHVTWVTWRSRLRIAGSPARCRLRRRGDGGVRPAGEVIASGTTGRIVAGDAGARIFAGLAPDLFAANRTGAVAFRAALAAGKFAPDLFHDGVNYFQNRNVTAIVMEVPTQSIGDPAATVRAWVTVSLCGHAPEAQMSRWGLPLITHIFITDPAVQDDYNRSLPAADVPRFSQTVADALARVTQLADSTDDPAAYAQRVVARLFPTTLPYSWIRRPRLVSQASMVAL